MLRFDDFILSFKEYEKLDKIVSKLDGDTQVEINKILHNLPHPIRLTTPDTDCPPEKVMIDRRKLEDMIYDLAKFRKEEMES